MCVDFVKDLFQPNRNLLDMKKFILELKVIFYKFGINFGNYKLCIFKFLDKNQFGIYLSHCDDSLAIHDNFLVTEVPGDLSVRGLGLNIKLCSVLLNTVDRLQFGGEGVRVGINLPEIQLNFDT